eukprot:s2226_g8.t1
MYAYSFQQARTGLLPVTFHSGAQFHVGCTNSCPLPSSTISMAADGHRAIKVAPWAKNFPGAWFCPLKAAKETQCQTSAGSHKDRQTQRQPGRQAGQTRPDRDQTQTETRRDQTRPDQPDRQTDTHIGSALLTEGRKLHVYAGAGVVEGSDPSEEFEEISLKMRQFTEAFADAEPCSVAGLMQLPNLNTLWATVIVEELVRLNVCNFVICPGSRSTPLVVAVARHKQTRHMVNHDERSGGFYALGWAKGTNEAAVIVTLGHPGTAADLGNVRDFEGVGGFSQQTWSGTAVANLLPAAVEAAQAQVPLLLLTADRPAELRDTGANQTIHQPGIFGCYTRWAKDNINGGAGMMVKL